jgi:hypothetical protein
MQVTPKKHRHFYWQLLLLLSSCFACLPPVGSGIANAQEAEEPVSESTIAQATHSQPVRRRLRTPFFEEQRKLRFGSGDFLESALDGADNFFSTDSVSNLSNATVNELSNPVAENVPGTLTVGSRDEDNPNFLRTRFRAPGVDLVFSNPSYGSDPRIGSITVNGTITVGGRTLTFNGVRNYSGSFSIRNDRVRGAIQLVDPQNPGTTILIQLPPTIIPDVDDDDTPIRGGTRLSIGLPTDR